EKPRRSAWRWPQAALAEGHRPRPRRLDPLAHLGGWWSRLRRPPAQLRAEGQPQDVSRRPALDARAAGPYRPPGRDRVAQRRRAAHEAVRRRAEEAGADLGADRDRGA